MPNLESTESLFEAVKEGAGALWVVSSTGAPWWVTRWVMGDPVRRQIGRGIKPLLSRKASFRMLTLYDMDRMTRKRAGAFLDRLEQAFRRF